MTLDDVLEHLGRIAFQVEQGRLAPKSGDAALGILAELRSTLSALAPGDHVQRQSLLRGAIERLKTIAT